MAERIIQVGEIRFRSAELSDLFPLMKLYQLAAASSVKDKVFLDWHRLKANIESENSAWVVGEKDGALVAMFSILLDRENRLAKINRLYIDPNLNEWAEVLQSGLPQLIQYLKDPKRGIEVVYTTARAFTIKQQALTLDLGFHVVGVLPMAAGGEPFKLNGVAAFYFDGVLKEKRYSDFGLHPIVAPFYELVRGECGLDPLPTVSIGDLGGGAFDPLPPLELIQAPQFVARRFADLEASRSIAMHFYPFTKPNALILDPDQSVEIYAKISPENHMATIIGEKLERAVNPTALYAEVARMLAKQQITYIEVINDAADAWGIECFFKAGYLPCAYVPCLKAQGEKRRDYVVLARSTERLLSDCPFPIEVDRIYLSYLAEYYKLEGREYLSKFLPT